MNINIIKKRNTTKKNDNTALTQAVDLLINNEVGLTNFFEEWGITKTTNETAFRKGIAAHLWYEKYDRILTNNARNGVPKKNLTTDNGVIEIEAPREMASLSQL